MQVSYVARSFLDYRIPVFESLSAKLGGRFRLIYNADYVPERVHRRVQASLGPAAIGLRGERRIGPDEISGFANKTFRLVWQPGMWKAIRDTRPDVLVGDGFYQWTSFALLYRLLKRAGLVVCYERTFHTERAAQWIRTAYRRQVVRWVDAMDCNGQLSREYSMYLGMPGERITVGHMAADSHVLATRAAAVSAAERGVVRAGWGDPDVAFLAVGRLNARKGIRELLQGWARLERGLPGNWRLILAGDGSDRAALEQLAITLGLKGVIFAGHIDYDGIARLYAAADALVVPTLEDNWSLVVPEAMACGLPVLCSTYNGCHPELIEPAGNGWVFDPLDEQSTFAALAECIGRRRDLGRMGERSRMIVSAFTPERAADSIIEACRIAHGRATARRPSLHKGPRRR